LSLRRTAVDEFPARPVVLRLLRLSLLSVAASLHGERRRPHHGVRGAKSGGGAARREGQTDSGGRCSGWTSIGSALGGQHVKASMVSRHRVGAEEPDGAYEQTETRRSCQRKPYDRRAVHRRRWPLTTTRRPVAYVPATKTCLGGGSDRGPRRSWAAST